MGVLFLFSLLIFFSPFFIRLYNKYDFKGDNSLVLVIKNNKFINVSNLSFFRMLLTDLSIISFS